MPAPDEQSATETIHEMSLPLKDARTGKVSQTAHNILMTAIVQATIVCDEPPACKNT
jgi:hypothetical protein